MDGQLTRATGAVRYVHPNEWRRLMREEADRLGWSHRRMRRELKAAGRLFADPWRVPLPVLHCAECVGPFFGFIPGEAR